MGLQQSKEALLYQQVIDGNIEGIKALHQEGASLEWFDKEGRSPLIVACMNPNLFEAARTLIELGASVNAYRPDPPAGRRRSGGGRRKQKRKLRIMIHGGVAYEGTHGGAALHHAANRGLELTVNLLLSHGANPLAVNDDRLTPLAVARVKGYSNVVRAIESHICYFSGWLRELHGPGFLESLVPQLLSRKVWVVVVPCGSRNPRKPLKLELAIYASLQDARPCTTITLWKAKIEEPNLNQAVPVVNIFDKATRTRYKLASLEGGDKKQLQCLRNACRGIPQVTQMVPPRAHTPVVPPTTPPLNEENVELAMTTNDPLVSATEERSQIYDSRMILNNSTANGWGNPQDNSSHSGWLSTEEPIPSEVTRSGWLNEPSRDAYNGWGTPEGQTENNPSSMEAANNPSHNGWGPVEESSFPSKGSTKGWLDEQAEVVHNGWGTTETQNDDNTTAVPMTDEVTETASVPSAPPAPDDADYGPIHYPTIDFSPVDVTMPNVVNKEASVAQTKDEAGASSCVICLDAPVEGACTPCGHMAGCMSCLNDIKSKNWGCPVCRSKIDKVIRLYAV